MDKKQNHHLWRYMLNIGAVFPLITSAPAAFASSPAFDCQTARGEIENLICKDDTLATLDRELAKTYGSALKVAQSLDEGANAEVKTLKAEQRGWISGRNDCWKDVENKQGCTLQAYQHRNAYLQARWRLLDPTHTVIYQCKDATDEYAVSLFPTKPLESIAIERGDQSEIFISTVAASGTKYEGSFGKTFWAHGKDAMITWEQNTPAASCKSVPE